MLYRAFTLLLVLAAASSLLGAQGAPALLSYQGQLNDAAGAPVTSPTVVRFTVLWGGTAVENPSSGVPVYQEVATVTPNTRGVFHHLIGSGTPTSGCDENRDGTAAEPCALSPADFPGSATAVFLEVRLDPGGANNLLLPRQRIVSVGYALNADTVDGQDGSSLADTLDSAYDRGGPGAGRTIVADAGAVEISGPGGLTVAGSVGIGKSLAERELDVAGTIRGQDLAAGRGAIEALNALGTLVFAVGDTDGSHSALLMWNADRSAQPVQLSASPGTDMWLANEGNVGIGTATPQSRLHVRGGSARFETASGALPMLITRSTEPDEQVRIGVSDSRASFHYVNDEASNHLEFRMQNTDTETGGGANANDNVVMVIRGDAAGGKVGIGVSSPTNIFQVVQNSPTNPIADAWTTYSSLRWKRNIRPIEGALEIVRGLRGVSFEWKETGERDIGMIAEEVGEVLPEVVEYEENGRDARGLDYARLVAVLVEAVKAQQEQIEAQEAQIRQLRETMTRARGGAGTRP